MRFVLADVLEAPFFAFAELGVAADYKKLLPLLTETLMAMLAG